MTFHLSSPTDAARSFGTATVTRISGSPGLGFFRLNLTIEVMLQPASGRQSQETPVALSAGTASLAPRRDQTADSVLWDALQITELTADVLLSGRLVGRFMPVSPDVLPLRPNSYAAIQRTVTLACDLDVARLEAIETARSGSSFALDINIMGRYGNGQTFTAGEQFPVNQGVWTDVLATMGFRRTLLVEIHLPDTHNQPELAKAVNDLEQAMHHMNEGHDRDAVGALRDALENVSLAFGDNDENIPGDLKNALFANSKAMTKAERLRVLRRALKLVTHPARHRDEVTAAIDWSRIDSSQLVFMTAAFINEMSAPDARPVRPAADAGIPAAAQ